MAHVTFIHGIANKPPAETLVEIWRDSLARGEAGIDLGAEGVTSEMIYWADLIYPEPQREMAAHESNDSVIEPTDPEPDMHWRTQLPVDEAAWMAAVEAKIGYDETLADSDAGPGDAGSAGATPFERVPLPWWLKRRLMKILLRDVHHYLFNTEHSPRAGETHLIQEAIRARTVEALRRGAGQSSPHIVVSHSMGTVIAYDCLMRVDDCPDVDGLMTVGSPLGLDEIQDKLQPQWSRHHGFPVHVRGDWVNVFDRLDPVAGFDARLGNDYQRHGERVVTDIHEPNSGRWRHNITKYLGGRKLRAALARQLGF